MQTRLSSMYLCTFIFSLINITDIKEKYKRKIKKLEFWRNENMLPQQLKLEIVRIFSLKRYIIFVALFGLIGIYFVYSGAREYKNFLDQKEFFITHEQDKMNLYASHGHYGDYGFRILYEPPPMSIFFNNSGVFENLYSTVDMTENLEVNRSSKGRSLLLKKGFFKDLAGMFFFFGSLFMVYMGMTSYISEKYFFKFGNVLIRLGILNSVSVILICAWYYFPKIFLLRFGTGEGEIFFYFVVYLLLFLGFFYGAGLLIRVLCRSKSVRCFCLLIFWLLSITIIPEMMNIFLQEKSQVLPAGDFLETGFVKNSKIEKEINTHFRQVIREYEILLLVYPTGFYNYLSGEVSGRGYNGYLDFVNYTLALRRKFIGNDKSLASLVKGHGNIFYARSFLPRSFPIALGLTLLYTIIFFIVSYVILKRRTRFPPGIKNPGYEFRKGNTYFVLCKNQQCKDDLFRYYQAEENAIGIDKASAEELRPGVGLAQMLTYFCKLSGVEEKKARENLHLLGVENLNTPGQPHRWRKEKTADEVIFKIYCAVTMAGEHKMVVVNDFLKGKSRELERQFLDLVNRLNQTGRIVLYLSCEIFLTSLPFEGSIKLDNHKSFRIDPQAVSLR
jgi:hypothetical protein